MGNRHAGHRETPGRRIRTAALAALLLTAYAAAGGPHATEHGAIHWGYGVRDGPRNWWQLDPAYRLCGLGRYQSPIDIRTSRIYEAEPEPLRFDYNAVPLRVIDNGHTIQVNYGPGSTMRIGSHAYELVQFHFHLPSEERIDGKAFPMVAHLVHRDPEGRLAVVAALLVEGSENPLFENVLDHLPEAKGDERTVLYRPINALRLLPARLDYYAYIGSLTTPPCSEGVNWYVLRQPVEISRSQIERFRRLYRDNVRPIQPINGRPVRAGG